MLGYNLFSQCFCGFKPLFDIFSPGPPQTGLDQFLAVFGGPSPQFLVLGISGTRPDL